MTGTDISPGGRRDVAAVLVRRPPRPVGPATGSVGGPAPGSAAREQGPRVVDHEGVPTWLVDGVVSEISGQRARPRGALARAGLGDDDLRPSDPVKRLADMDLDGLQASVIYGPSIAACRSAIRSSRRRAGGCGTTGRPSSTPARPTAWRSCPCCRPTTRRPPRPSSSGSPASATGARWSTASSSSRGTRQWDRLWRAAEMAGLPLSFHIGGEPGRCGRWRTAGEGGRRSARWRSRCGWPSRSRR